MMKNGNFDPNSADTARPAGGHPLAAELDPLVYLHIDNNDYTSIPDRPDLDPRCLVGRHGCGRLVHAQGHPGRRGRLLVPVQRRPGPVANDTLTVLADGKNPVLAHLFLNYMMDLPNVLENISFNGYMQPINGVTPQVLTQPGDPASEPPPRRSSYRQNFDTGTGSSWSWPRPSTPGLPTGAWLRVSGGV